MDWITIIALLVWIDALVITRRIQTTKISDLDKSNLPTNPL